MYATAQRVKPRQGADGVNAFLHMHDKASATEIDWTNIDGVRITARETGQLVSENLEVAPGGNQVLSYIDIICQDDTPLEEIHTALDEAVIPVSTQPLPIEHRAKRVLIRFGANLGLEGAAELEYQELASKVVDIIQRHPPLEWGNRPPLRIEAAYGGEAVTFRLATDGGRHPDGATAVSLPLGVVHVSYDTLDDFSRMYGDLMPYILPTITGLDLKDLRSRGGVKVIDTRTNRTMWEWPRRESDGE